MTYSTLSQYSIKLLIALGVTLGLILLNNTDKSSAELRAFDLKEYFEDFQDDPNELDLSKYEIDYTVSEDFNEKTDVTKNEAEEIMRLSGTASHYADKFHGRLTANGEIFNMYDYSCAHKKLPFGTILKVTEKKNGKSILVRVNDRGPYVDDRIIDLSFGAASYLGNLGLPKITAEGFNTKEYAKEISKGNYYFGFSEKSELICVQEDKIKILESVDDFTQAVKFHRQFMEKTAVKNVYIFVKAQNSYRKYNEYFIGYVKSEISIVSN